MDLQDERKLKYENAALKHALEITLRLLDAGIHQDDIALLLNRKLKEISSPLGEVVKVKVKEKYPQSRRNTDAKRNYIEKLKQDIIRKLPAGEERKRSHIVEDKVTTQDFWLAMTELRKEGKVISNGGNSGTTYRLR